MNNTSFFRKFQGTPAQILIVVGLAATLFVPVWQRFEETGVARAKAQLDKTGQLVKVEVDKFKKGQENNLKQLYQSTALTQEERQKKADELRTAAYAKQEELQRTFDETPLKRDLLAAQAKVLDTRWRDLLGWVGRLMLLLGLLIMTIQSEGLQQKILLVILLVVMLSSIPSLGSGLMMDHPAESVLGSSGMASAAGVSDEIANDIARLSENLPVPPPPPPVAVPMGVPGGIQGGVPGGFPGGVVGGILGGKPPKVISVPPPPRPSETPKPPATLRIPGSVEQANLIRRVDPVYPPLAKAARIQGAVVLEVHVSKQGNVENISVLSGHPLLIQAAVEAVKQWQYRPVLLNGEPVDVVTTVTVNFSLM